MVAVSPDRLSSGSAVSAGGWLITAGFVVIALTSALYAMDAPEAALPVHPFVAAAAIRVTLVGANLLLAASVIGVLADIAAAMGAVLVIQHLDREGRAWASAGWVAY